MAAEAASSAFVVQTRTADGGCGPGHVLAPQRTALDDGQGQGGARDEVHGRAPDDAPPPPPPQEPGTQHFKLDDEDSVPELSGLRPDLVLDPGPPVVGERHSGVGYEILLDVRVPQLDRDLTEPGMTQIHQFIEAFELVEREVGLDTSLGFQGAVLQAEQAVREREQEEDRPRSSNKRGGRRKRKKRRKKLPQTSSSSSSRRRGVDMEIMHEHAGDLYVHDYTLHAEPLNSVHSKEITGYMDEIIKLIEEKVIVGNMGEEIILKNESSARYLYGDRTHVYKRRWLDWEKNRHRHVRRLG